MVTQMNTKRIWIFLAITFGITCTVFLLLYLLVGTDDPEKLYRIANNMNYIILPVPVLANLATRLITKEGWGQLLLQPNFRRGWRFYLAAWLLPVLATIVGGTIYYLIYPHTFDPNVSLARAQFAGVPALADASSQHIMGILLANILFISPVLLLLPSFGEEFGWQGYLMPRLVKRFSGGVQAGGNDAAAVSKAVLLVGVIWGMFHWPWDLFLLKLNPGLPVTYLLVRLLSCYVMRVLLAWVSLRSGSVWPAVIGHGMLNASIALVTFMLKGNPDMILGPQPAGLIGGLGFAALALVLLSSRKAFAGETEIRSENSPAAVSA